MGPSCARNRLCYTWSLMYCCVSALFIWFSCFCVSIGLFVVCAMFLFMRAEPCRQICWFKCMFYRLCRDLLMWPSQAFISNRPLCAELALLRPSCAGGFELISTGFIIFRGRRKLRPSLQIRRRHFKHRNKQDMERKYWNYDKWLKSLKVAVKEGSAAHRGELARVHEGGRVLLTEIPLPRIARLASNCSTGSCLYNFDKRTSSKSSNWEKVELDEGFQTASSPLPRGPSCSASWGQALNMLESSIRTFTCMCVYIYI